MKIIYSVHNGNGICLTGASMSFKHPETIVYDENGNGHFETIDPNIAFKYQEIMGSEWYKAVEIRNEI